jgi:S-adenosylmethionine synthetase
MRNFHLPLPEQTYTHLRAEAERAKLPATALAREAIDWWLRQQLRHLDPDLEAAGIEHLVKTGKVTK